MKLLADDANKGWFERSYEFKSFILTGKKIAGRAFSKILEH